MAPLVSVWLDGYAQFPIAPAACGSGALCKWIQTGSHLDRLCQSMTAATPALQHAIEAISVPGISIGHRFIADGDELALLPDEIGAFAGSVLKVRRASGAARIVARELLSRVGHAACAIPRSTAGMPVWPDGIVGSLAHDSTVAVAAIASRREFLSVGIDIEPSEPLDAELVEIVATLKERRIIYDDPCAGRVLFAVKEAVYKAVYPLDRVFLDHHDVEVDLAAGTAIVRNGRAVSVRYVVVPCIVALAYVPVQST